MQSIMAGMTQWAGESGAGGGFRFCGNAKRTTLMDVIRLFEEIGGEGPGAAREPGAQTEVGRAMRQVMDEIDAIAQGTLRSITIDTMLKLIARQHAGTDARG